MEISMNPFGKTFFNNISLNDVTGYMEISMDPFGKEFLIIYSLKINVTRYVEISMDHLVSMLQDTRKFPWPLSVQNF